MSNEAQQILDSGELELYALGILDPSRIQAVERCLRMDDVLRAELEEIQRSLENFALLHAEEPRPELRSTILQTAFDAETSSQDEVPTLTSTDSALRATRSTSDAKNIVTAKPRYFQYAVAASVACFFSSSAATYFWYQQRQTEQQLGEAQLELAALKTEQQVMAARLQAHSNNLALLTNPNVRVIKLQATATAPIGSASVVMWNVASHDVYVEGNALPANKPDTDYQLWALIDGKPVDLGTFNTSSNVPVTHMKSTARADAFAITLEPKGGSSSPTMAQLFVLGKTS